MVECGIMHDNRIENPAGSFIQAADGLQIFTRRWEAAQPKAACVVIHGLGEHSGRYEALAHDLNRRSFSVWALDHRGHGRSQGRRGDCVSIGEYTADMDLLVDKVRETAPTLPRILLGHSLGGLLALRYAAEYPEKIKAVAISSPALRLALKLPRIKVAITEWLARVAPATPVPNGVNPRLLCHDPEVAERYRSDPLVHRVITARCAILLREAMRESRALADRLRIPCLILQAGSDAVCDPEAAGEFAEAVPNRLVEYHRYEGLYHEIFNEPERDRVIDDLCRWMDKVLAS